MCQAPPSSETSKDTLRPEEPIKKRRGRKPREQKTETEEDEDFVPSEEVLLQEEEEEYDDEDESDQLLSEVSESELESGLHRTAARPKIHCRGFASNGLHNSVMAPVWKSLSVTHGLREQFHSPWEFAEWVPSARKWACLSESEAEQYLPSETKSPFFSIRREGLQEDSSVIYRINRFNALQPHKERLDMTFFVGGPVWAMEWCPTPEGSLASQYVAIYCNPGMDDQHSLSETHVGPALLQLWELGSLRQDAGSATKPGLAFAIATDHGCIWDMKFCPSGAWEPPSVRRKAPQMSRLGLLAVAFSDGQVLIYSLPHLEALQAHQRSQVTGLHLAILEVGGGEAGVVRCHYARDTHPMPLSLGPGNAVKGAGLSSGLDETSKLELSSLGSGGLTPRHAIYKVQCVASLQVSSVQAGSPAECGQCFTLAWMPSRPHHHLAAGFYDGTVALWNLSSTSLLQRVRQADGSHRLYPFRCFLAHDHAIRSIQWCKANSNFLVTAGSDRKIKFWDLRRLHEPLNSFKRSLSTEVAWLLPYSGVTVAQDNCYAPYGLCGIHYLDAGYLGFRAYFVAPRKGTVWSISGSDWLNTVAAGDVMGELVAAMMPDLSINPHNVKRPSDRRFSIYKADLLPRNLISKDGSESASTVAPTTGAGETSTVEGRSYSESVAHNYILFQDTDLVSPELSPSHPLGGRPSLLQPGLASTFPSYPTQQRSFKNFFRRKARKHNRTVPERKEGDILGRLQLEAIHKVRFSPNLGCHSWLASGGQSGLVRLHCLRALVSPLSHKLQLECQAQFSAMLEANEEGGSSSSFMASPPGASTAVS
ncbi:hypothetical protein JD844_025938 [Phrynosoma platyrhinos]|uniref:General transcription factor 3C polypeptide 2 n=1 Tax=Phrynosoma platyrhinos TaxID=52577 RepID=A0ABQ7T0G1_PHRPL|nr:hypothetical protein JD844_025938 [Phrynosoma platyrhinos]